MTDLNSLEIGENESQTSFTLRVIRAEAWERGRRAGFSNAMRRMSDEPNAPEPKNPYLEPRE